MAVEYDNAIRYADATLKAHNECVREMEAVQGRGAWGAAALLHRGRIQFWLAAQSAGVHQWTTARGNGAVCTCGLISCQDPTRDGNWRLFFGWLGHLDAADRAAARYVVTGGPYNHVLWCAFCGPAAQVARTDRGELDRDDLEAVLQRHLLLCPVP